MKETASYSILSVIAIAMEMIQGRRILKQEQDDIQVQYLDDQRYWYSLSKLTENQPNNTNVSSSFNHQVEEYITQGSTFVFYE